MITESWRHLGRVWEQFDVVLFLAIKPWVDVAIAGRLSARPVIGRRRVGAIFSGGVVLSNLGR